jgi:hypothetical protein
MKARIIGFIFVFGILAALYVLTGGDNGVQPLPSQSSQPASSADADLKGLKIQ